MKAALQQLSVTQKITQLRRAAEALLPYVAHRAGCAAALAADARCTCGLNARVTVTKLLCTPNAPPTHYQPRKYG